MQVQKISKKHFKIGQYVLGIFEMRYFFLMVKLLYVRNCMTIRILLSEI